MILASIPSPPSPTLNVGGLMIHYYALFVIAGVITATAITARRWAARGGQAAFVVDVAIAAVPAGLVGARVYHVASSWQLYFGPGGHPDRVLAIWDGGLSIWGAIAGGVLGAWLICRRRGISFAALAGAAAAGVPVGQAIGRIGCYFNQELYGGPTTVPWAIRIDPANRPPATPNAATYHPAFAYEALWDLGTAGLVIWAQRRFRLQGGRAFAVYAAAYTAGRAWIEALRVDPANHILGVRVNIWTSLAVFAAALAYLIWTRPANQAPLALGPSHNGEAVAASQPEAIDEAHNTGPDGTVAPAADPPHRPDLPVSEG